MGLNLNDSFLWVDLLVNASIVGPLIMNYFVSATVASRIFKVPLHEPFCRYWMLLSTVHNLHFLAYFYRLVLPCYLCFFRHAFVPHFLRRWVSGTFGPNHLAGPEVNDPRNSRRSMS
ncbi:unnamed protein product [Cuscuta europaea]|uniref:Uncharacterized protein n=1 Tax=Cuscuta europaea TaxID=41803 RepID=A0A9P1DZ53_CUSEU|nr:unnamed protein product [Cuscuta europaea]